MNKQTLLQKLKAINGLTNQERSDLIELINTKKRYGIVWEDKPKNLELFETENRTPDAGYSHRISTGLPR